MPKDDMFKLMFIILKECYLSLKKGKDVNTDLISAEALEIPDKYHKEILIGLIDKGYVKGVGYERYINGLTITNFECITITPDGVEYLKENSMMKKVAEALSMAGDLIPML